MKMTPLFDHVHKLSHCFPTSPTRRPGIGHWLVAYRKAEETHHRNVFRRVRETHKRQNNGVSGGRTLNKDSLCLALNVCITRSTNSLTDRSFVLQLRLHCVDEPFELSSVNITEQNLHDVNEEDLNVFKNVVQIDASLNSLSLGHFKSFVSLRELDLSLNKLQDMVFDPADFPHLEVLDLSYNSLSTDAVAALGRLSRLRVLHLTENQLHHLSPNLSSSNHDKSQQTSKEDTFKSLEVLMLDDNKLSSDVFNCLTNLKRLKYLNLKGNLVTEVPLLDLLDHLKTQHSSTEQNEADRDTTGNISENIFKLMQFLQQKDWDDDKEANFPFPELQCLNLSCNKIAEEEALLAVALFPMLSEIDISSNPLTTRRSGDPPLLTFYLQDKLGVKIKRRKEQEVKTVTKVEPKWKARKVIPNVSKKTQGLNNQTHTETKRESAAQLSPDQITEHKTELPFFVTETEDYLDLESVENPDNTVDFSQSPTDIKPDLTSVEPIGIQTAVRMLEHTLKNLNVYRDSKPKLDSIQTPYRERAKRIKALPAPPALPPKQQSEQLARMIEEIKVNRTMREVPLTKVIQREDGNRQDYKEAVSLLKDMRAKYKTVHGKTMEQAASLGSERPTN